MNARKMNAKDKEIIKSIVELQVESTFEKVGDKFFLLDGDITLTHLLFKWVDQNKSHNSTRDGLWENQEL